FSRDWSSDVCSSDLELRPAHGAEVRDLGRILGQGLVVEGACGVRVQAQVELVFPAEFEARLGQGIVTDLRTRMTFCEISSMRGDLVGDDAGLDVIFRSEEHTSELQSRENLVCR